MVVGYIDKENRFAGSDIKFTIAIGSIIPLSYYIGMGIARFVLYWIKTHLDICLFCWMPLVLIFFFPPLGIWSISAQSNFAVGAVVNATFGSITELTFYITALLKGHQAGKPCLQEIVKSALTGTLLGCILFIPVSQHAFTSLFAAE